MAASSLVADYFGSSSDEEEDENGDEGSDRPSQNTPQITPEIKEQTQKQQQKDYFSCADESHSSEEENENKANTSSSSSRHTFLSKDSTKLPNPFSLENLEILPSPSFIGTKDSTNSVFVTSFQRAEEAKQSILERHVKMTTPLKEEKRPPPQRKKSVCRSFQLGKCRYGYKCRYGHDLTPDTSLVDRCTFSGVTDSNRFGYSVDFGNPLLGADIPKDSDDDSFRVEQKRRTRSGVSDSLIPPKRSLFALDRQRQTERPWTSTLKKQ